MASEANPRAATSTASPAKGENYPQYLRRTLGEVIDTLALQPERRLFLKNRWLEQVTWMEGKAQQAQRWYYVLRISALLCGLVIPVVASLNFGQTSQYAIVVLGLVVATTTALEEFFKYGDRWRHYRQVVERLKIEGWRFFQLVEPYESFGNHEAAYQRFADGIEELLRRDIQMFITEIATTKSRGSSRRSEAGDGHLGG